jgi:putative transposase
MLVGVATRQYHRSLEPVGADVHTRGTSKSAVRRRFVAKTAAQLAAWRSTALDALDLVGLWIDGVHIGEHCRRSNECGVSGPGGELPLD